MGSKGLLSKLQKFQGKHVVVDVVGGINFVDVFEDFEVWQERTRIGEDLITVSSGAEEKYFMIHRDEIVEYDDSFDEVFVAMENNITLVVYEM
jgi:hypothetical protein